MRRLEKESNSKKINWWKESIGYQCYISRFKDSNGDGR